MAIHFSLMLSALRELGPKQLGLYARYQLGLRSGYYRWRTRQAPPDFPGGLSLDWLSLPQGAALAGLLGEGGVSQTLAEADEIVAGQARLFGAEPVPLQLTVPGRLRHWTESGAGAFLGGEQGSSDIKFIWEPARFGWAFTLARAYSLNADEHYPLAFWRHAETFLQGNPPYQGPHWASAQEAALRLIAFVFSARMFLDSPHSTPERLERLAQAIAAHAARIPATLVYARAQNNNHLLSEAAGLYTAGLVLPQHPAASRWRALGWRWFNRGVQAQVAPDGAYGQHSANYQRLVLQIALWMDKLARAQGQDIPEETHWRLAAATRWLILLLDRESGRVPNLGPNDSSYLLPLTVCAHHDYRPSLQAASLAWLGAPCVGPGPWDEMARWLTDEQAVAGIRAPAPVSWRQADIAHTPHVIRLVEHPSWAYLRAARFNGRPGHADQLHLDLWWRSLNLAQDPGTYLYNAPPPWDNALTCTQVHNTLSVNGREQMQRAGRFLYLRRAQAQVLARQHDEKGAWQRIVAQHEGYQRQGVIHRRSVAGYESGRWLVEDRLLAFGGSAPGAASASVEACLHWLLPDWDWQVENGASGETILLVRSPHGLIRLAFSLGEDGHPASDPPRLHIARAGERVYGSGDASPIWGWSSPRYGDKIPALAVRWTVLGKLPVVLCSEWILP